jgi:hypothetical protein
MDHVHWELSVLSRAIAYKNLSGASTQVGLSQPQLSRIIAKLEKSLNVVLLDRTTKRNAAWTPTAFRLVEVYSKAIRSLDHELTKLTDGVHLKHIKIGALEGLISTALPFAKKLLELGTHTIDIGVYDLNQIEELFFRGEFDLLFVPREPGRKKFKYSMLLGYQVLEKIGKIAEPLVMSSFEYATQKAMVKNSGDKQILISNSLAVRKQWIDEFGGEGIFPSAVLKQKPNRDHVESVFLLGNDNLSSSLWEKICH